MKVELIITDKLLSLVKYKLVEDIEFGGANVPAGFVSDGATVPRSLTLVGAILILIGVVVEIFFSWVGLSFSVIGLVLVIGQFVFPQNGVYMKSAIVHDWLLICAKNMWGVRNAHKVFNNCLKLQKLDWVRRSVLVGCVTVASYYYYITVYRKRWRDKDKLEDEGYEPF